MPLQTHLLWVPIAILEGAVLLGGEDTLASYTNTAGMQDHTPTAAAGQFTVAALADSSNDITMIHIEAAVLSVRNFQPIDSLLPSHAYSRHGYMHIRLIAIIESRL